jgi:hypothetical protein
VDERCDARRAALLDEARFFARLSEIKYRSHCGADLPDAELNRLEAKAFRRLAGGEGLSAVLTDLAREWSGFAADNNRRVNAAPRVVRGPMAGHSSISHRWADPEKVLASVAYVRAVYRRLEDRPRD